MWKFYTKYLPMQVHLTSAHIANFTGDINNNNNLANNWTTVNFAQWRIFTKFWLKVCFLLKQING